MKIGILGGGGCFSLNYARYLHTLNIDCFGIGRSRKSPPFHLAPRGYRYHVLHLVDQLEAVLAVLDTERPDVIVNFAAQGEGAASFLENAPDFFRTNTWGLSKLVLELRKREYLTRFIQIGTSELYGSTDRPAKETDCLRPTSPYAISKAAFDQYLETMYRLHGFPMNIIRPSNCYTPGQQLYRIIPKAIVYALSGRKLPLQGGGVAEKSYLHAMDLSRAIQLVIDRAPVGETYNVAPNQPIAINTLVRMIASACGVSFNDLCEIVPDRVGQDSKYWLNTDKIKALGWQQVRGIDSGISEMVDWVKSYPELLTADTTYRHRP